MRTGTPVQGHNETVNRSSHAELCVSSLYLKTPSIAPKKTVLGLSIGGVVPGANIE
jgi:hypothetical protein